MKQLFLPYNLALLAKEKGFDEPCLFKHNPQATFDHDKINLIKHNPLGSLNFFYNSDGIITAPLYQQMIDWFFDKHHINVVPDHNSLVICTSETYYRVLENNIKQAFELI